MQYTRHIQRIIETQLYIGKVIVVYGARRVGKTTMVKNILNISTNKKSKYINCELLQNKTALETTNSEFLKEFIGNIDLVVLDEAQSIVNIGLILKILVDTFPDTQILATGSSSFELAQKVSEPLTGRTRTYTLFPLSYGEIKESTDFATAQARLESVLRFGSYPSVYTVAEKESIEELNDIASKYLYKDILVIDGLKRKDLILKLLRALAFQIGNEVSFTELANSLGENVRTIQQYIELLEQCFVIFKLPPYSRNLRKEVRYKHKIFFWDLGIRNSLIQSYNSLSLRNDIGALWENYWISERLKYNHNNRRFVNAYFWKSYAQNEIDYVEEEGGTLHGFELKWNPNVTIKKPVEFLNMYSGSNVTIVNRDNYWKYL